MATETKRANGSALLPFLVFIVLFMGFGIYYLVTGVDMPFYQFPTVTAMFVAVIVAFIQGKGTVDEKFATFSKGAANLDVLTMLIIYIPFIMDMLMYTKDASIIDPIRSILGG